MTPETAIETFINCKKNNQEIPSEVIHSLKTYKKWNEKALTAIFNASAYFPEIMVESNMEESILKLIEGFKKRIIHR